MVEAASGLLEAQDEAKIREALSGLDELREAVDRVETYQRFQPERRDGVRFAQVSESGIRALATRALDGVLRDDSKVGI